MNDVRHDELEWELKQRNEVAEILARQLNEKIDEYEELKLRYDSVNGQFHDELAENKELKSEVARLESLVMSMELSPVWTEFE